MLREVVVDGHVGAIARICARLDQWRLDTPAGPAWPYWITRERLHDAPPYRQRAARPSWCYGTAGLARAQQLAALATGDMDRARMAEQALARALTDPDQLAATTDLSLCHGYAGLAHIARRAATAAVTAQPAGRVPHLLDAIIPDGTGTDRLVSSLLGPRTGDIGLLEGAAGIALVLQNAHTDTSPTSGWDACLLIG
jgi:hypothetical protein